MVFVHYFVFWPIHCNDNVILMLRISFQISILLWIKNYRQGKINEIHTWFIDNRHRHKWIGFWWQWSQNISRGQLVGNLDSLLQCAQSKQITLIGCRSNLRRVQVFNKDQTGNISYVYWVSQPRRVFYYCI